MTNTHPADTVAGTITHALDHFKTIAVVGLSPKTHRDSYEVAQYMQSHGYRIVPVNPAAQVTDILGEKVYATLAEAAAQEQIDLVNIFRNSADVPPIVDDAIAIGAKGVWMQLGIEHTQATDKALAAGLQVVQNHCLLIEHRRRHG